MTNKIRLQRQRLRINARVRLCSRTIARQLGVPSSFLRMLTSVILSSSFSNLIFLPLLSLALFVVYMAHHGFFSYDFFSEGVFGMKLFVFTMVIGLVLMSFMLFGSGILLYARRKGAAVSWLAVCGILFLNVLFLILMGTSLLNPEKRIFALSVLGVTLYLAVHFGVFFFAKLKVKIMLLFVLFFLAFDLVATQPNVAAKLLGNGLRIFGVGGEIPIEVVSDDGVAKGRLILLTPKYIYFKEDPNNALIIQALDKVNKIRQVKPATTQ